MTSTIKINCNHFAIRSLGKRIARDLSALSSLSRLYYQLENQQHLGGLFLADSQNESGQPQTEGFSIIVTESLDESTAPGPAAELQSFSPQTAVVTIKEIADSNSELVEALQESLPAAQQPDLIVLDVETPTGVDISTIHMIRVNREVEWDGFLYQPKHTVMVFFVDGTMYKGLNGVLSGFDPVSARQLQPESWYEWQSDSDGGIQIRALGADDNEPMVTLDINHHTVTSAQSLDHDSALVYKSMEVTGSPLFGYVRTSRFEVGLNEDGQYSLSKGVLATAAGIDSGLSVSASLQDSEQSLSTGSANFDGGMVLVNSTAPTTRESALSGRYELSDYELTLYADDGSVDRLLFLQTSYGAMIGNRYMQLVKQPEAELASLTL